MSARRTTGVLALGCMCALAACSEPSTPPVAPAPPRTVLAAYLVGVAAGPAAPAMIMLHREKPVLYVELFASIASIPIAYVLVQHLGLIGPPIAVLWASLVRGIFTRCALARAWRAA